jgi:hypothetical protein
MNIQMERLIEMGRRRGGLTVDDLQRHLPLEALSPAQLAEVMTTIEDAGVSVEINAALTRGRPGRPADRSTAASTSAEDAAQDHRKRIAALGSSISRSKEQAARAPHFAQQYRGGTVFLGVAVALCIMLVVGLWVMDKGL